MPAVGNALVFSFARAHPCGWVFFLLHVFALLLGMLFSYPLWVHSVHLLCWLAFLSCTRSLASLLTSASVSPRERRNHKRLRRVMPWFVKGLRCLDELFARPRADPRVLFRTLLQNSVALARRCAG